MIGWMNSSTETDIETNTLLYYHTYIHTLLWYFKVFGYVFNVYAVCMCNNKTCAIFIHVEIKW